MVKLAWCTDIHLNFLDDAELNAFTDELDRSGADAIAIGGDIAEAPSLEASLRGLSARLARPIYFVLGNHDYYHGSIADVRARVRDLCDRDRWLRWLSEHNAVELTNRTALIGHGGWGDARLGNAATTPVRLNDFYCIQELVAASDRLTTKLNELGDEAASHVRRVLTEATARHAEVVMLTHVPPFRDACWHAGAISDDDWLPYFTCHAVGEVIVEVMQKRPECTLTVLCGHTHGAGVADVLPNVRVETGAADYGEPRINRVLELV